MFIRCLMDDMPGSGPYIAEHGLSFWVESEELRLLIDAGTSPNTLKNAKDMGVELEKAEAVILTHGHYDHTGGLESFFEVNSFAEAHIRKTAAYEYYNHKPDGLRYIGMSPALKNHPRLHFHDGDLRLNSKVYLFGGVTERELWPTGNVNLKRRIGDLYINDCFDHEQYAVIHENGKRILFGGCAHAGIINILEGFRQRFGAYPDGVFSGFHMMKSSPYEERDLSLIRQTACRLASLPCMFYTGHCTSHEAYLLMKPILGDRLMEFHSGDTFEL